MLKKCCYLLSIMALALASPITSATYYVSSSSGNDANGGTSEATAWQTIDKVKEFEFDDNSTVLFKRGDIFRGTISTNGFVIGTTFGAYGTGENPIIAGSVPIIGWTPTIHPGLGANIYEADVSAFITTDDKGNTNAIEHLFVNSELMTIARYPNVDFPADKNWLKVDAGAGTDAFTDPALVAYSKPNSYWKGATLRIRTYSWYYKVFEVTDYSASNGKITAEGLGNQLPEWGYFLDGKLEELDHPGEWYYDAIAQKVYFYPKNGANPNNLLIEGSTYGTGINVYWHEDNTTIADFTFRHFTKAGANINSSDNVTLRNCHFEYNTTGVTVWNSANVLVSDNTLEHHLKSAIGLNAASDFDVQASLIEKNKITNTGMFPLYCRRYSGTCYGIGISVFGKAQTVRQNIVENTGWNGINLKGGGHHIIENNVVHKALSLLNDGGAIAIGSNGNIIRGNFLLESIGNVDESNGCGSTNSNPCMHHPTYGMGIGSDSGFKDNVIEGNTIANNPDMGIRLNAFTNTIVRNNVVYNNDPQIVVQDKKGPSHDNVVEGNIIYSLAPDQIGLSLTNATNHGTFDNNVYCNPYSEVVAIRDGKRYSLAHWQNKFPSYDQHSNWCGLSIKEYSVSNVGTNLIGNSTFDTDVLNWKGNIFYDANKMDGGSLQAVYKGTGNLNVMPNTFDLIENQWYRLQFSIIGNGFGNIQLRTNDTTPGGSWQILKERYFAYDQNRNDYEMFFQSPRTTSYGKHLFITKDYDADNYWLDNVTFEPVDATLYDATKKSVLFTNPTANAKTISLEGKSYWDLNGNTVTDSITLAPFTSQILILSSEAPPAPSTPPEPTPSPSTPPEPTPSPSTPPVSSTPSSGTGLISCSDIATLHSDCNGGGKPLIDLKEIEEGVQIVNATIVTEVTNNGWLSNVTIGTEGIVSGGIATGFIIVSGYFGDFDFRGASVSGVNEAGEVVGTLGGTIFNNSKVRGSIQDVLLDPNTSITGGILRKTIIGDPLYPAFLEELTIASGSHLDNVIIGPQVDLAENVSLGAGVEFVMPGVGIDNGGKAIISQTGFLSRIRTENQRHANGVKLTPVQVEKLQIEEQLFVETKHVGQSAELIIVAYHKTVFQTTIYMRVGESWKTWDGEIAHLEAATQYEALAEKIEVSIFEGNLSGLSGEFTVYIGYRLETEQSIIFNGDSPLEFSVEGKE